MHGEYAAPPVNGHLYTEEDWNTTSSVDNGQAYHLSKVVISMHAHDIPLRCDALRWCGSRLKICQPSQILSHICQAGVKAVLFLHCRHVQKGRHGSSQRSRAWTWWQFCQTLCWGLPYHHELTAPVLAS